MTTPDLPSIHELLDSLAGPDSGRIVIVHGDDHRIEVRTSAMGRYVGRHGATALEIRRRLCRLLGDESLRVDVGELPA